MANEKKTKKAEKPPFGLAIGTIKAGKYNFTRKGATTLKEAMKEAEAAFGNPKVREVIVVARG